MGIFLAAPIAGAVALLCGPVPARAADAGRQPAAAPHAARAVQATQSGLRGGVDAFVAKLDASSLIAPSLLFIPMTPCRVADTRSAYGPFGGPALGGGQARDFSIPSSACGIPAGARAYSFNIAVVPGGWLGFLSVWPAGQPRPVVATLNSLDGRIKSNSAIAAAGAGGAVSVYASDPTHVIIDINGYFVDALAGGGAPAFYPVAACRVLDTLLPAGPLGGPALTGGSRANFPSSRAPAGCRPPQRPTR
jgi:hypothetical protein